MPSGDMRAEHFVTIFDRNYLAAGLCLYRSLRAQGERNELWVVCMDETVEQRLRELALPGLHLLPLAEVETDALRRVLKAGFQLEGASDHGVSEALYLRDPDDNGVELYWDRPKDKWPQKPDGSLQMFTHPLDLHDLLAELDRT